MRAFSRLSLVLLALAAAALPAQADDWNHAIVPYGWGAGLDCDVTIRGQESSSDASVTDILENIEFAGMLRYEGHSDRWGVMFDALYLGMGFPSDRTAAELDIDAVVLELDGSWHANEHFEVIFGARYYDLSADMDFDVLSDVDASETWVDGVAGFRGKTNISENWKWYFRGDIGAGGSDIAWNAETAFVWNPGERFTLALGWRVLAIDYESGSGSDEFAFDGTLSGPFVGAGFRF